MRSSDGTLCKCEVVHSPHWKCAAVVVVASHNGMTDPMRTELSTCVSEHRLL